MEIIIKFLKKYPKKFARMKILRTFASAIERETPQRWQKRFLRKVF